METLLEVSKVSKRFGGLTAVCDLDFKVREGEIVGLIGPNGAGKTTLFNLITGFDVPDSGEIRYLGQSILHVQPWGICRLGITRTFQQAKPMIGMTILENVVVGALKSQRRLKDAVRYSEEILEFLGLTEFRDVLAENLPIGYRKVLEIAKCLSTKPKLLLLDEALAGLNHTEMSMILDKMKRIRSQGVTILLIEHVMVAVMSISDRILVLDHGELIAEGTPEEITRDPKVVEAYFGEEVPREA
jgi:branched-chain amino acid transport system ATP-binding protein